jgi:TRAP-type C4-dicarboxylate transport system permease small subunit
MNALHRLIKTLHWLEDAVLVFIFIALMFLAFTQIAMRNFFSGGWLWADPALRILVLWIAMWGASVAARHGHHIRIELAPHYLPQRWLRFNLIVCDFACAAISTVVAYYSTMFVMDEYSNGGIAFAAVPVWWCELIIPVSLVILALRYSAQTLATILRSEDILE